MTAPLPPPCWIMVSGTSAEGLLLNGPTPLVRYARAGRLARWRRAPRSPDVLALVVELVPEFGARLRTACAAYLDLIPPLDSRAPADPWDAVRCAAARWQQLADLCESLRAAAATIDYARNASRAPNLAEAEELIEWLRRLEAALVAQPRHAKRPAPSDASDDDHRDSVKRRALGAPDPPSA